MSRDKLTENLIGALKQALAHPEEQRLFRSGKLDGLFPSRNGVNADAAALALRENLLEVTRTEERGKVAFDWVRITPQGVEFLHEHDSPIHALRELHAILKLNREAIPLWLEAMQQRLTSIQQQLQEDSEKWLNQLEALSARVDEGLRRLERATPLLPEELIQRFPWAVHALTYLDRREQTSERSHPCPLPELFNALKREHGQLTLTEFHEGLRRLQVQRSIQLLSVESEEGLPQPEHALFDAGQVFYLVARDF